MTSPGATGFGFFGLALESTKGTAAPASAATWIPVTRADSDDATDVLPDQGMRGSMATLYGAVKGTKSATYEVEGDVFLDTIGFFLAGILGADTVSGSAAPFTHVFTLNNDRTTGGQCPSYTIWDYSGLTARKFAGGTLSSLTIRCSAQELLTYSASFTSKASATDSTPTPSFSNHVPVPAWVGTVTVGASANALVQEAEVTLSRNVSVVQTVDGSTDPIQIWQGPLAVSGRLMFVANDETEFLKYLSVDDGATPDGQVPLKLKFERSVSGNTYSLELQMSQVVYNQAKVERGEDFTQVSAQFDAIANLTDAASASGGGFSPIKVTLINDVDDDGTYIDNS